MDPENIILNPPVIAEGVDDSSDIDGWYSPW
jgi:hypothetical protein